MATTEAFRGIFKNTSILVGSIVCVAVAPLGIPGFRISNETVMVGSNRIFGNRFRKLLWARSDSLKLDLSDDFMEDFAGTRQITTKVWKRKRGIVRTNLKDVAADAEIDMNKRIERLARESSQHGTVEDSITGPNQIETTTRPEIMARLSVSDGRRLKRRISKKRRRSFLNPFKRKPDFVERNAQINPCATSTTSTPCMGIFEKKMKEFRAEQKMKSMTKQPGSTTCDFDAKYGQYTTKSTIPCFLPEGGYTETTESTFLPPYVTESTDFSVPEEGLSPERYLIIRHALRNYSPPSPTWSGRRFRCRRGKRGCRQYCLNRRYKKEPPCICLPFIKRGQDEMLTFMINILQAMLEKSCDSRRPYALDKIWCKAFKDDTWESIEPDGQTPCETSQPPCQKVAPCGSFAILPLPLPLPPCSNLIPVTLPPTTTLPSNPICCPPSTSPVVSIMPIPSPCTIFCPDLPKTPSYDSLKFPTTIIPTFFAPWPTTKPACPDELYPQIKSQFEPNIVSHCCLDTFPPWPTPPTFMKFAPEERKFPMYHELVDKPSDYNEASRMDINPEESKLRKYEFESPYDSLEQDTTEQSEIDIPSQIDYDLETGIDQSEFDLDPPSYDMSKQREFPTRTNHRRRHQKAEFSRKHLEPYMASRQKRNEVSDEDSEISATTTTAAISKIAETENSNRRNQFDLFVDKKKSSTMRAGIIGRGPKRLSNHQGKVFDKVYPESYSERIHAESSTAKVEKTTLQISAMNPSSLMHLQLLAVCEGYLDMIKRLNMENQSRGEVGLIKYCENELSKGFDSAKAKKSIEGKATEKSTVLDEKHTDNSGSQKSIHNKVVVDILRSPVYREMRSHFLAKNSNRPSYGERRRRRKKRIGGYRRRPFQRMTTENADSIRLLRKKKGALVSWLFNKESAEAEEEEGDGSGGTNIGKNSSTTSVRRKETSATPEPVTPYPVYAKMYGYDKGGELSDIEVLLRSLNERNETREIAKNVTVLAMLMNPEEEERDTGLVEDFRSELKHDSAKSGGKLHGDVDWKKSNGSTTTEEEEVNEMIEEDESTQTEVSTVSTVVTTILGHETTQIPKKNRTRNGTYEQAISSAKELVKDYTIEFLNYAVYIIPIMFILLFLACCLGFIIRIMTQNRRKRKRAKGKRKLTAPLSSETESDSSESSMSENRKKSKSSQFKQKGQKLWSAVRSIGNKDEEGGITRKWKRKRRKSGEVLDSDDRKLLKRLRRKNKELKDMADESEEKALVSDKRRVKYGESNDTDHRVNRSDHQRDNVAEERRELIALLEELKTLEDRDRKESKSVFVQYMTSDYDNNDSERALRPSRGIDPAEDEPLVRDVDHFLRMSQELSAELLRGNARDIAYKFQLLTRMIDTLPMGNVSPRKKSVLIEEMENFKRRLGYGKYTKLKENGVLCRP